jgi:hypothetical protein
LNSTNNSTIIYTYSFSDERFSLSCDLSLNRLSKVSSVPFKTTRASFRFFTKLSVIIDDDAKERSVMCCFKKKKRKEQREREKTGE